MGKRNGIRISHLPPALGLVLLGSLMPPLAHAGISDPLKRMEVTALMFGESHSASSVLAEVVSDVEQMAAALRSLGVATKTVIDADRASALTAISTFAAESPDKAHIMYFSGYGGGEAGLPNSLLFMSKDDVSHAHVDREQTDIELLRLRHTILFSSVGKLLARTSASVIIVDSSLNPQYELAGRQLVATSGGRGRGDEKGGYFTQQVTARLRDLKGASLLDALVSAARATRSPGGEEDPVLLVSASMPTCRVIDAKLMCIAEERKERP